MDYVKNKINEVLTRGVAEILPSKEGLAKLMQEKKITLYQGFDPSMPSLHLGNFVGLMKLRQFQKLGHKVIFLVGDFTGMIGDPTDKLTTRKKLTRNEVLENTKSWREQAGRILSFDGLNAGEMKFNSSWLSKLSPEELIELSSHFTVQQIIERDFFQDRLKQSQPIFVNEFLYPLFQGYDSIAMDVDLEIGGSDQIFNMLAGRTLMKAEKGKEKYVLATKLLVDKEGNKVGKTTGNALFLDSTPENFYAGIMSFPDETIDLCFELLTEVDLTGISEKVKANPMGEKKRLAFEIVKLLWGEDKAKLASDSFENIFQEQAFPENALQILVGENINVIDELVKINAIKSKSDFKRLVQEGAIDVNGKRIEKSELQIKSGDQIKIGKKIFVKVE